MKLDLINSRIPVELGPRIFDSIEGEFIQAPPRSPKAISKASFLSKQHRLDYSPKTEPVPDRFNLSVVDSHGNFLPVNKSTRVRPKNSISKKKTLTFQDTVTAVKPTSDDLLSDTYPSKIADHMKDRIYNVIEDTVENRLNSRNLPGGVWEVTGRKSTPPAYLVGPGDYEVYDSDLSYRGRNPVRGGHFKTQPSGREHDEQFDPEYLPLKERKRYQRMKAAQDAKLEASMRSVSPPKLRGSLSSLSVGDTVDSASAALGAEGSMASLTLTKTRSVGGSLGGAGTRDRFDDRIYKQECFVKTSGMTLSADWDKKLIKKIPFSFQPPSHANAKKSLRRAAPKSEGADVDVDVGHFFSIVRTAELSPVRYSAAFR